MGLLGVLLILFIVLKALGLIAWSWWVVFIPLYIWVALATFALFLGTLLTALGVEVKNRRNRWFK